MLDFFKEHLNFLNTLGNNVVLHIIPINKITILFDKINSESLSTTKLLDNPNIILMYSIADDRVFISKITQPISTSIKVYIWHKNEGNLFKIFLNIIFSINKITPKYIPQAIKLKLAPCQRPVVNQTTNKFRI